LRFGFGSIDFFGAYRSPLLSITRWMNDSAVQLTKTT